MPLQTAFEQLLLEFGLARMEDSLKYYGVLMQISAWLENNPMATCSVYRMRPTEFTPRRVNTADVMRTLQQGPASLGGVKTYPGDFHIKAPTGVTIQIHNIQTRDSMGAPIIADVPVLAIWIPNELSRPFLVQQQP